MCYNKHIYREEAFMKKKKITLLSLHVLSLIIFEIVGYIILKIKNPFVNEIEICIIASDVVGKIHFIISLILVICVRFCKKITKEYKNVIYTFPIMSFFLPFIIGFKIVYIIMKIKS